MGTFNPNPFNGDITAPELASLELGNFNDSIVVATFNEPMNTDSVPNKAAFELTAGNVVWGIDTVYFNAGDSLLVVLDSIAPQSFADSTLTLAYTPASPYLQDVAGNQLAAFDSVVVNNLAGEVVNLLNNGDFSDGITGWTLVGDSLEYNSDNENVVYIVAGSGTFSYIRQLYTAMVEPLEESTDYTIRFDIVGEANVAISDAVGSYTFVDFSVHTTGTISLNFTTPAELTGHETGIQIMIYNVDSEDSTFDNIVLFKR
jgi:hypothetical protein